ncbi:MAG: hypothetical protein JHD04_10615, partial [Nocardioides sp.]|nr:hypothetical protein [Nocardioides sp.]
AAALGATGTALASSKASVLQDLAQATIAQDKGEPAPSKGSKLKKLLLVVVLAAVGGVVAKKLQGGKQADNWQSSYVPSPATAAPATPASPAAPLAGVSEDDAADAAGSSPDEAIADRAEAAHPITTPDERAEVVDLDGDKK